MVLAPHRFDLRAVGQLLHRVAVLRVVLQQDGHLEGGRLQRVPIQESVWVRTRAHMLDSGQIIIRLPVLEAVGDQLSFGQVIQPGELPAAVSAGVERCEALVAALQLQEQEEISEQNLRGTVKHSDPGTGLKANQ